MDLDIKTITPDADILPNTWRLVRNDGTDRGEIVAEGTLETIEEHPRLKRLVLVSNSDHPADPEWLAYASDEDCEADTDAELWLYRIQRVVERAS
jgi:hypothetical protein